MDELKKALVNNFELIFWITAILLLAVTDPHQALHFELCPLKLMGITWCPGCGLGHSISYLFRGEIVASVHAHWLGIPAFIIIARRIWFLSAVFLNLKKLRPHA